MEVIVIRLAFALVATGWGVALIVAAGNSRLAARDPALRFYRIPLIPETLYATAEAAFLAFALVTGLHPAFAVTDRVFFSLRHFAAAIHLSFGFAYALYCQRNLTANGISPAWAIPPACFAVLAAANYAVFALQFPFPAKADSILFLNKALMGIPLLWAGLNAVAVRGEKTDFYPSTKGGFWVAVFCLAYFPFPGIADAFSLAIPWFDADRPVSLQLHPFRELVVLGILTAHCWPVYAALRKTNDIPVEALSAREAEVASLLLEGAANGRIAEELHISLPTVKTHVRNVLRKQGASSRVDFVRASSAKEARR